MTKTAEQALIEYETQTKEIPGLKNAYGPVRHPPAGEAFVAGFVAGWDFRGRDRAADIAEARENFAAMTGDASRLEAAMEAIEVESALRIAHLEERVLELQLALRSERQKAGVIVADMLSAATALGVAPNEDLMAAARRMAASMTELLAAAIAVRERRISIKSKTDYGDRAACDRLGVVVDSIRHSDATGMALPMPTSGVSADAAIGNRIADSVISFAGSGLHVYTRDRRARELTVAEVENRDPVAHCTMCPECGAPLGDHVPVVLYRVRPEDPLWEVRLRCPPAVKPRTVRDVLGTTDAETDAEAAARVMGTLEAARKLLGGIRATLRAQGDSESTEAAVERVVRERDEARRQLIEWRRAAAAMLGRDPDGTLDDDVTMLTTLRACLDDGVAKSALITSGVATALSRQGVTLPEQPALGDLVAGVRTLGERAQRTIPGKPGARTAASAEAQLAALLADLIDALGLDPDMTHAPASIVAEVRERMERHGRLASVAERRRRDLAYALASDADSSMGTLIDTARDLRIRRDRLAETISAFRERVAGALHLRCTDHTDDAMIEAIKGHVDAREAAAAALDAVSRRVTGFEGGSVVEAVHNLSLLAQKRGEALVEALDGWEHELEDIAAHRPAWHRILALRPLAVVDGRRMFTRHGRALAMAAAAGEAG